MANDKQQNAIFVRQGNIVNEDISIIYINDKYILLLLLLPFISPNQMQVATVHPLVDFT